MKIKQHKEKLEIIRDIIRETLLGNAALIVLAAMVPVVLVKPWDSMTFIFMGAVCVSFAVILFWLVYILALCKKNGTTARVPGVIFMRWGHECLFGIPYLAHQQADMQPDVMIQNR